MLPIMARFSKNWTILVLYRLGIDAPEGVEGERRRDDKEEEHSRREARLPADEQHQPAAVL